MTPQEISQALLALTSQIEALAESIANIENSAGEFPKSKMHLVEARICLKCNEPIKPIEKSERGCHYKCYRVILRQKDSGEFTDEQAVIAGTWLPRSKGGRKPKPENEALANQIREASAHFAKKASAPAKGSTSPPPAKP